LGVTEGGRLRKVREGKVLKDSTMVFFEEEEKEKGPTRRSSAQRSRSLFV